MKNNLNTTIQNLKLTAEEKDLILRLNKKLSSLVNKSKEYLEEMHDNYEKNLEDAFIVGLENKSFIADYKSFVNQLQLEADGLLENLDLNLLSVSNNQIDESDYQKTYHLSFLIKNTLQNFEQLFIKNLKIEVLDHAREVQYNQDYLKKNEHYQKILLLLDEINAISKSNELIEIDSLDKDYKFLVKFNQEIDLDGRKDLKKLALIIMNAILIIIFIATYFLIYFNIIFT